MSKIVSVFIPTYNGQDYIEECLSMVAKQELPHDWSKEVIVIDSSSTDRTPEIIQKTEDIIFKSIPKADFQHGKTRQYAAEIARGEFIAYLTQDAIPASTSWLSSMIEPFLINKQIVAVCGKQIPRKTAPITIKREVSSVFGSLGPDHSIMIHRNRSLFDGDKVTPASIGFLSDVNAAYRRSYLIEHGFKSVNYAEDQSIGNDIVFEDNLMKAYTPYGSVIHSNDYGSMEYFYRKVDERLGLYESLGVDTRIGKKQYIKNVIRNTLADLIFTIRDKDSSAGKKILSVLILNPIYNLSAAHASYLPIEKLVSNKKLSLENRRG